MGKVGLEPTTALSTGFTVRGGTNYTVLTHIWQGFCVFPVERDFEGSSEKIRKFPLRFWWNRLASIQRRAGLQPAALPTELRFHLAEVEGLELSSGCPRRFSGPVRYQLRYTSIFGVDDGI